jgi:dephospho-CoA kinase
LLLAGIVWPTALELIEEEFNYIMTLETFAEVANEGPPNPRPPVAVIEAAVLLKAGWHHETDEVWLTSAPHDVILERLVGRGLSAEEAQVLYWINSRLSMYLTA